MQRAWVAQDRGWRTPLGTQQPTHRTWGHRWCRDSSPWASNTTSTGNQEKWASTETKSKKSPNVAANPNPRSPNLPLAVATESWTIPRRPPAWQCNDQRRQEAATAKVWAAAMASGDRVGRSWPGGDIHWGRKRRRQRVGPTSTANERTTATSR
jgi:hypothetical protein